MVKNSKDQLVIVHLIPEHYSTPYRLYIFIVTSRSMEIRHTDNGKKGRFYIELEGREEAELVYVWAGEDKFIIEHTEVSDALRGKNAGKQLVARAVEFAREKKVRIIPLCPFANAIIRKTPEYADILK